MRFDRFTVKAQEAIQAAEQEARQRDHQGLQGAHLLAALLHQSEGVVRSWRDGNTDPSRARCVTLARTLSMRTGWLRRSNAKARAWGTIT